MEKQNILNAIQIWLQHPNRGMTRLGCLLEFIPDDKKDVLIGVVKNDIYSDSKEQKESIDKVLDRIFG